MWFVRLFSEGTPVKASVMVGGVAVSEFFARVFHIEGLSPDLLFILWAMMLLDMVTGMLASRHEGERIHSKKMSVGVYRKISMLVVIASGVLLDAVFSKHGLNTGHLLFKATTSWFIGVEALSLYENADRMGLPIPPILRTAIEKLLQRDERRLDNMLQP